MNAVFTPDAAELKAAAEIVRAVASASASGQGAAVFDGRMVDLAHAMSSLKTLQRAEAWGVEVPEYPALNTW